MLRWKNVYNKILFHKYQQNIIVNLTKPFLKCKETFLLKGSCFLNNEKILNYIGKYFSQYEKILNQQNFHCNKEMNLLNGIH